MKIPERHFNKHCNCHVPNEQLFSVNQVTVVNDCCTDDLQDFLKQGWHILSVCPQPNQRRPDYVLGRSTHKI